MKTVIAEKSSGIWKAKINKYHFDFVYPYFVTIENTKDGFIDYPLRYEDGKIVYDVLERIPAHAKKLVEFMLITTQLLVKIEQAIENKNTFYYRNNIRHYIKFLLDNNVISEDAIYWRS